MYSNNNNACPMPKDIKRILVSQPKPSSPRSPYFDLEKKYGVELTFRPLFSLEPVSTRELRDQKIDPNDFTALVLTSRTMTDHLFTQLKEMRIELDDSYKYYCLSEMIVGYLQKFITVRKRKVYTPENNGNQEELIDLIIKRKKERFLIPTTEGQQKEDFFARLDEEGIDYSRYVITRTTYTSFTREELDAFDGILFFSPNGVDSLFHNYPDFAQGKRLMGCLGEGTKQAMEEQGLRVDIMAPTPQFPSMTAALEAALKKH